MRSVFLSRTRPSWSHGRIFCRMCMRARGLSRRWCPGPVHPHAVSPCGVIATWEPPPMVKLRRDIKFFVTTQDGPNLSQHEISLSQHKGSRPIQVLLRQRNLCHNKMPRPRAQTCCTRPRPPIARVVPCRARQGVLS